MAISSPHADRFRGTATAIRLADTDVFDLAFSPMTARRATAHIRRADPEQYFLLLVHGSPIGIEQRRNNALLAAGDMALFDTSHPLTCEFRDDGRLVLVPARSTTTQGMSWRLSTCQGAPCGSTGASSTPRIRCSAKSDSSAIGFPGSAACGDSARPWAEADETVTGTASPGRGVGTTSSPRHR